VASIVGLFIRLSGSPPLICHVFSHVLCLLSVEMANEISIYQITLNVSKTHQNPIAAGASPLISPGDHNAPPDPPASICMGSAEPYLGELAKTPYMFI